MTKISYFFEQLKNYKYNENLQSRILKRSTMRGNNHHFQAFLKKAIWLQWRNHFPSSDKARKERLRREAVQPVNQPDGIRKLLN